MFLDAARSTVFGVVVVVFPNMAMAAQEKGQEEEEEEEENPTKSNATRCTTRYRTHVSPPKPQHSKQ